MKKGVSAEMRILQLYDAVSDEKPVSVSSGFRAFPEQIRFLIFLPDKNVFYCDKPYIGRLVLFGYKSAFLFCRHLLILSGETAV